MRIALTHRHYDPVHLEAVMAEMARLGAPTIRAVWMACWDVWAALEGCHRIRAALALGLVPEIEEIEYSDELTPADLRIEDADDAYTVAQIADAACSAEVLNFGGLID
jgi:hypothetical protein